MSSGITTFTAIRLDDKDLNDPNSGFYTAQATTDQINSIPADSKEAGELLYNKTTGNLALFSNGTWSTLISSVGTDGNIVINSYPTAPIDPVEGEVYYNTTDDTYQVYTNGAWQDITTSDSEIVAKSHATDPTPVEAGLIYYNTTSNTLKTQNNTTTDTIVTTTSINGDYVVKNHATDPSSPVTGEMYYNTTDQALKAYSNLGWAYVNPKPNIFLQFATTVVAPGLGSVMNVTGSTPTPLPLFNSLPQGATSTIHSFLFATANDNSILYSGTYGVNTNISVTINFAASIACQINLGLKLASSNNILYKNYIQVAPENHYQLTVSGAINLLANDRLSIMLESDQPNNTSQALYILSYTVEITTL